VQPDRVRAADAGFTATEIGRAVNALVDGAIVTDYWYQGRQLDLIIKGRADWTRHTQDISHLPMATPTGRIVTVGDVADVSQRQGPVQINHVERQRTVSVETTLPDGIALEEAMRRIEEQIVVPLRQQGQIGGLYDVRLSGTADDLTRLKNEMFGGFNVAVILTFLLLAALFQSYVYPFVVMLTVPLGAAGGILGLRLIQLFDNTQQLDVLTMLGFVILVGTVVNNSILLVYHALDKMREGVEPREAVKDAVRVRVRPIFMTTGTTVCGMLPLVIMPGAGSELYRGMGAVIVGGLAFSTVITLFLTPLVFTFTLEGVSRVRGMFGLSPVAVTNPPDFSTKD
jgi:HAE1 family hydrophobic/amphiphilic exporter-1